MTAVSAVARERSPLLDAPCADGRASIAVEMPQEPRLKCAPGLRDVLLEVHELSTLALPVVVTTVFEYLPGTTATILAGHLDSPLQKEFIDAATLSTMFTNMTAYTVVFGLSSALDTLCSQALIVVSIALAPILLVNYHTAAILEWLGQDPLLSRLAGDFSRYNLVGLPCAFLYDGVRRVLQAQGELQATVVIAMLSNVVQIGAGLVLAYVLDWGFAGIALSRALGNVSLPLMLLAYFWWRPQRLASWWRRGWDLRQAWAHVGLFLRLGTPSMLMQVLLIWAFEALSLLAGVLPDRVVAVSAHSIVMSVMYIVYMVFVGVSVAANIRVGNLLGAGDWRLARLASRLAIRLSLALGVALGAAVWAASAVIPPAFVDDPDTIALATQALVAWAPFELAEALNCVMQGVFKGAAMRDTAAWTNALSFYAVGLPLAYVLAFPGGGGVEGLWVGLGVGVFASFGALFLLFRRWRWRELAAEARDRTQR
ncbi:hypothetical protein P43SY_001182 [Pythium insidiosum]|uniref:Multidrug/Oligosaccharidyl-lipid/Polysaccharide (MOP) Flippase Superfamily n=1 Tax=Pythium insidiosum TaxID=114742 RepID=A0AAD5LEB1_PYTIN|nr:hypothetical protein P43SY_001182 [Pythium insidiosum]